MLGTAPAIFGMAAAAHILCELAGAPFSGEPMIQLTGQQYDRALSRLQQREEEVFSNIEGLPVDRDDVSPALVGGDLFRALGVHQCAHFKWAHSLQVGTWEVPIYVDCPGFSSDSCSWG